MNELNAKIIVCCHKPDIWKESDIYLPVQGGKAISQIDLEIQGDNSGDNISIKNKTYCELTSLYWAWKNLKGVDYLGLCHYRRYFNFHTKGSAFSDFTSIKTENFNQLDLSTPNFDKLFQRYDIVLAKPRSYSHSIFIDYCVAHFSEDIIKLEHIIERKYPEYKDSMVKLFHESNKISHYNMFIMKWNILDQYCKWLFDVLAEAEKEINISNYSEPQKRIWGYMGERLLLLLFVYHHQLKVKYYPVYFINDYIQLKSVFHRFQRYLRKNIAFAMIKERNKKKPR
ncbi:MAG: DUF4422 domain-containing protein [Microbacter sp.]